MPKRFAACDHARRPHLQRQPRRHCIHRLRQRRAHRHLPEVFAIVVARRPTADADRQILDDAVGRVTGFQRGQVDERLEGRAGLARRFHGAVELRLRVAASADHRQQGTVAVEHHCRRFARLQRLPARGDELLDDGGGVRLHAAIERRLDDKAFGTGGDAHYVSGRQLLHDVVDGVVGICRSGTLRAVERVRDLIGRLALLVLGYEARLLHLRQHETRARPRDARIGERRILRGRLQQAGDHRRLAERQVARRFAEVAPRRRVDAVGAAAEVDAIEVELEDVGFRQPRLEPQRQRELLELAREGAVGAEIEVLGQLLRQRRAALHGSPFAQVGDRCAHHAQRVDAVVVVEALILGGDHRVGNVARQQIERHVVVAAAALGDDRAVARQDAHERRVLLRSQRQRIGIDHRVIDHQPRNAGADRRHGVERQQEQALQRRALALRRR